MNKIINLCGLTICFLAAQVNAAISVQDDFGNKVALEKSAQRVIAIAPHITELLFAAGGGEKIIGLVNYSDYPEAAKKIAHIGDNSRLDMERVIALKPDLLVVWKDGCSPLQVEQLKKLGIPIFYSEPHNLDDIPSSLVRLGQLLGTEAVAQQAATDLRQRLATLAKQYSQRPVVRVFYQVWDKPLYTLNGKHIVSHAIKLCGGENIFAEAKVIAPNIGVEAVLQENPEAIIGTAETNPSDGGVDMWKRYPSLTAVINNNLFLLNGDHLNRAGPRMIDGTEALCERLEQARTNRQTK